MFLNPKIPFFAETSFAEHKLSEEIIQNEVSLGGSPTSASLPTGKINTTTKNFFQANILNPHKHNVKHLLANRKTQQESALLPSKFYSLTENLSYCSSWHRFLQEVRVRKRRTANKTKEGKNVFFFNQELENSSERTL